mmetsp:Transcript_18443/g.22661  ORF Transcript_18443/g.22661 Transcript_18443/m.22661 type:complete len:338 (+) Transcript_18443:331-1344(+)|eukprot:CAMPEP_0204841088 /NCGR_PEP_ID=MMETSP1346-20131115/40549_1 /ASSEMBLY_ACC=CAM_ASM_000771 /TAXON_ID=215587 /ORGANISM="Aplanochytrium stocchinoi, Strain GSBS06" /LENGTH=337 /DNA_ID=CAMNT_0051978977 /DNA_START=366 /DNA_END=1379 /DNA_ORIENTATION=-
MASAFTKKYAVAVLGAAGGIGQPLSLLLNGSPYVSQLNLYDVVPLVNGVAADLSHIETGPMVTGYAGDLKDKDLTKQRLHAALKGVEVAVIPAGLPRKPGMTRDDLFAINAGIVSELVTAIAEVCPKCMICIISNPVNSTVPIAAEILKAKGIYDPKRLFGVSTLDVVRSNKFVASLIGANPDEVNVPVIGGHSGVTILPLLSAATPSLSKSLSEEQIKALTERIQNAGTEVVEAKAGGGSATLSMAFAGARFATSVMKGMSGEHVVECSYVQSDIAPGCDFFASPITLGLNGIERVGSIGKLSEYEEMLLQEQVIPELKKAITKGQEFAKQLQSKL